MIKLGRVLNNRYGKYLILSLTMGLVGAILTLACPEFNNLHLVSMPFIVLFGVLLSSYSWLTKLKLFIANVFISFISFYIFGIIGVLAWMFFSVETWFPKF